MCYEECDVLRGVRCVTRIVMCYEECDVTCDT